LDDDSRLSFDFRLSVEFFILLMMTQGQDSFTFGFQWITLGQEFQFFLVRFKVTIESLIGDSGSGINFD
jgi:hypothetical protein